LSNLPSASGEPAGRGRPAAFLDRDGVINVDFGYVSRVEDLVFTPTAIAGIRALNEAGFLVLVVSNQSGIARGLFTTHDVDRFHQHMQQALAAAGARIDAFYYCPFHRDGVIPEFAMDHEDRKPSPGMLLRAMREWPVDRAGSFMIGDKMSDIEVAERAGIPGILVPANVCDLAAEARIAMARFNVTAAG